MRAAPLVAFPQLDDQHLALAAQHGRDMMRLVADEDERVAPLEAVRALTGWGQPLTGRLAILDMLDRRWREVGVAKEPTCPICSA